MAQGSGPDGAGPGLADRIEAAIRDASTLEIALAFPPGSEPREEAWIGHRIALGVESYFPCPACQSESPALPWARVVNDVEWRCDSCATYGTRWTLIRAVLESPPALRRFLAHRRADGILRSLDLEDAEP